MTSTTSESTDEPANAVGTVLVTGATGKTGRHVASFLRERGVDVRAASRHPAPEDPQSVIFDWARPETYAPAVAGADRIYLVQPAGVTDASAQVTDFLARARTAGAQGVVLLSALGVDLAGEELGFRKVERAVMGSGLEWTILRPNWFMQNFTTGFWLPTIAGRDEIPAPAGDAAVSFIDTRDIAAVATTALAQPGHAGREYTLTGGAALSFPAVAETISDVVGRPVRHVDVTDDQMRDVIRGEGLPSDYAEGLLGLFQGIRAGWNSFVTDVVPAVTGRAAIPFADYAKDHAEHWGPTEEAR